MTNMETAKVETIRGWYERTTRKTRKIIGWASILTMIAAVCAFFFLPHAIALRLQVFNGAYVIPIAALIWIMAFVYIFLVPSREVGFRSQESLDKTTAMLEEAVEKNIKPAAEVWQRLGKRLEEELEKGLLTDLREAIKTLRETAHKLQASTENSSGDLKQTATEIKQFTHDMKPAIDALKRIQGNLEAEIKDGFFDRIRVATERIEHLGGTSAPVGAPPPLKKGPNLASALEIVSKKHSPVVAPAPVAVAATEVAAGPQGSSFPQGPLPVGPVPVEQAPGRIEKLNQVS